MISVVIPVKNNARELKRTLTSLVAEKDGHEVLVVDGESIDGSLEQARDTQWVRLIRSQGTLAARLNEGAEQAKGDILLFLDAGMVLERGWAKAVEKAASLPGFSLGCFRVEVVHRNPIFRVVECVSWLRVVCFRLPRRYQALFVRAGDVKNAQVFLDIPVLEDLDLSRRMRLRGRVEVLKLCVMVPPARWLDVGLFSRFVNDVKVFAMWSRGAQPTQLATRSGGKAHAAILFCSNPKPGKVKKWLGNLVGAQRAARVYQRTIDEILSTVERARIDADRYVFYRPKKARFEMSRWLGERAMLVGQTGRTDTDRRKNALKAVFDLSAQKMLILGTHCPAITPRDLRNAVCALDRHDMVIGPTDDGGCYLIGVNKFHEDLFAGLIWDPENLFQEITAAAVKNGLSYSCLNTLRDFDGEDDLNYNWSLGYVQD